MNEWSHRDLLWFVCFWMHTFTMLGVANPKKSCCLSEVLVGSVANTWPCVWIWRSFSAKHIGLALCMRYVSNYRLTFRIHCIRWCGSWGMSMRLMRSLGVPIYYRSVQCIPVLSDAICAKNVGYGMDTVGYGMIMMLDDPTIDGQRMTKISNRLPSKTPGPKFQCCTKLSI